MEGLKNKLYKDILLKVEDVENISIEEIAGIVLGLGYRPTEDRGEDINIKSLCDNYDEFEKVLMRDDSEYTPLAQRVFDIIAELLAKSKSKSEWVSVEDKDKLPKNARPVLTLIKPLFEGAKPTQTVGQYTERWYHAGADCKLRDVTHWQEVPESTSCT